jgi:hypothetical protein
MEAESAKALFCSHQHLLAPLATLLTLGGIDFTASSFRLFRHRGSLIVMSVAPIVPLIHVE